MNIIVVVRELVQINRNIAVVIFCRDVVLVWFYGKTLKHLAQCHFFWGFLVVYNDGHTLPLLLKFNNVNRMGNCYPIRKRRPSSKFGLFHKEI